MGSREHIISVNLDGMLTRLIHLGELINTQRPIIALIQDMPLSKNNCIERITHRIAPQYTLAKSPPTTVAANSSTTAEHTDAAILVCTEKLEVTKIHNNFRPTGTTHNSAIIGVSVVRKPRDIAQENNKSKLIIFCAYIRPRTTHSELEEMFAWIENTARANEGLSHTILMGDFNSSSPKWGPVNESMDNNETSSKHYANIKETRGRYIEKRTQSMKLTCLNRPELGPTYINAERVAYIDLAFIGSKANRQWKHLTLNSLAKLKGHKVLTIHSTGQRENTGKSPETGSKRTSKRIRTDLIKEEHLLTANIESRELITNWVCLPRTRIIARLNKLTTILYKALIETQNCITITRVSRKPRSLRLGQANARTRRHIRKLKRIEQTTATIRHQLNLRTKTRHAQRIRHLRQAMKKAKLRANKIRETLINGITSADISKELDQHRGDKNLWQVVKIAEQHLNRTSSDNEQPTTTNSNQQQRTETEGHAPSSDTLTQFEIDRLAEQKFPHKERLMRNYVDKAIEDLQLYSIRIDDKEIDNAIRELRKKNYTGPEGINMKVFYTSIRFVKETIYTIARMSFFTAYVPEACRTTLGIMIPKKKPGEYRIVHVSSPLAALLELIALKRLEYRLEINKLNSSYQFGFCALRGRHDLVARILEIAKKHKQLHNRLALTTIVSLDIKGAFDNVNQDKLIEKMDRELGRDPLKFWLADFILNRWIKIRKGQTTSERRQVCTGVPQGSALGPILWNYVINDVERGITIPGHVELLKYADDIVIVATSIKKDLPHKDTQNCLDQLETKLHKLELELVPAKSSYMIVGARERMEQSQITIDSQPIEQVQTLSILGIKINHKLKLDLDDIEFKNKLSQTTKYLYDINQLEIVNSAQEWRVLIDSHLTSRLVVNNWPLLAIDKLASKRIDILFIRSLRTIFSWPGNCSTKLIRLITGLQESHTVATRMARLRGESEFSGTYKYLLMTKQELSQPSRINPNRAFNLETNFRSQRRKQYNPDKMPTLHRAQDLEELMNQVGPIWALLDRKKGSLMAELLFENILQKRLGKHAEYGISYFNSFALLLNTVRDRTIENRNLIMPENNSIIMALENYNNHDWRVIELRESIHDQGWRIYKIKGELYEGVDEHITAIYKSLALRTATPNDDQNNRQPRLPDPDDIHAWMLLMETGSTTSEETVTPENAAFITFLKAPYLGDYREKNRLNSRFLQQDKEWALNQHTSITRALCSKPEVWKNMTPNWLDGQKMLALTGLIQDEHKALIKGHRTNLQQCEHCLNLPRDHIEYKFHNLSEGALNSHVAIHRAFKCHKFRTSREQLTEGIRRDLTGLKEEDTQMMEGLEGCLRNRKACQRVLRHLARCAMNIEHPAQS